MKINIEFTDEEIKSERWQSIPYYEAEYEASNLGRIRTKEGKTTFTQRHGVRHWQQRILKPKYCVSTKNKNRFDARVSLWKDGKSKTLLVARIVLATFKQEHDLFSNMTVNHIDNNPLNNKIENLEWCSRKENIQKGFETGAYSYSKIKLTNKLTGEGVIFTSMAKASCYLNQNQGYISYQIKKGIYENYMYKWEKI